ncbi:hypothetical protein LE190_16070 [Massilia oculi]|uniref:Uncharacterized protein n=1 Tax=Massilia hydrophila TaxID=3044279 RepID=A0ABS7YCJ8_9BURK|nr:hypothetical protein [Massilia oculi]MCA1857430.1 hypothetical protein [Massilia oculi]
MEQIISRDMIRTKGAAAFDKGLGHDEHGMNPGSPAIDEWQAGWRARRDEVAQAKYDKLTRQQAEVVVAEVVEP